MKNENTRAKKCSVNCTLCSIYLHQYILFTKRATTKVAETKKPKPKKKRLHQSSNKIIWRRLFTYFALHRSFFAPCPHFPSRSCTYFPFISLKCLRGAHGAVKSAANTLQSNLVGQYPTHWPYGTLAKFESNAKAQISDLMWIIL